MKKKTVKDFVPLPTSLTPFLFVKIMSTFYWIFGCLYPFLYGSVIPKYTNKKGFEINQNLGM